MFQKDTTFCSCLNHYLFKDFIMLTKKKIILGMLVFLFFSGFSSAVIAGGYGPANGYLGDKDSIDIMGNDGIEFAYSPMTVSSDLASASSRNTNSEVIEFDYSPRKSSSIGSVLSMKKDREDIEFDYSPRPVKCGISYC